MRAMRTVSTSVALLFLSCVYAHSAQISQVTLDGKSVIGLDGEIKAGDVEKFKTAVKAINGSGRNVYALRLNSSGGNIAEAVSIADIVQFGRMAAIVPAGAECASACFIIFAAGNEKYADYTAFIGVHGASDYSGQENGTATVAMARIVKELGVPSSIIGKMVVTPPDQIIWLTPDDLRAMGASLVGRPNQLQAPGRLESQLPPSATSPATKPSGTASWSKLVSRALALSKAQNNGSALFQRVCQAEYKICINAVFVRGKSGNQLMLRTEQDMQGKVITRQFCEFNKEGNVRVCTDWDTNAVHRDIRGKDGKWLQSSTK